MRLKAQQCLLFLAIASFSGSVYASSFSIANCVLLDVGGTITVTATKDGQTVSSYKLDMSDAPYSQVAGNCTEGDTSHSLTVHFNQSGALLDWTLVFTTNGDGRAIMDQMIKFTPAALFQNDSLPSDMVVLSDVGNTPLSLTNASFVCRAAQRFAYDAASKGGLSLAVDQVLRDLQVQAFNLEGQSFSPAEDCEADAQNETTPATEATTAASSSKASTEVSTVVSTEVSTKVSTDNATEVSTEVSTAALTTESNTTESNTTETTVAPKTSSTTAPAPEGENTYVVHDGKKNETCIVLRGDITFTNIVYNMTNGKEATAEPISIPPMNQAGAGVTVSGSCDLGQGRQQQLVISFYQNLTLTLTFARPSAERSMLRAEAEEKYSLTDIQFDYALIFPNASDAGDRRTVKATNLTDFMTGSAAGGSFKCNSQITQDLDNGVQMETSKLQYKAFNTDDTEGFGDEVSECSADDSSSNVVPIAVGAAIGGLVVIMLIAYIISRQRKRKGGYNSI